MSKEKRTVKFSCPGKRMELTVEKEASGYNDKATLTIWVDGSLDWTECGPVLDMLEQAYDFAKTDNMRVE